MFYLDMVGGIAGDMFLSLMSQAYGRLDEFCDDISDLLKTKVELFYEDVFVNGILCKRLKIKIDKEPHIHRTFRDIKSLINSSGLEVHIKRDAEEIFKIIAKAEGKIHGKNIEDVHFHEVGAVDSIIDIVGAAWYFNKLGRPELIASCLKFGSGIIKSAHGLIPVPAPATLEISKGMAFERKDIKEELTSPTGAAVIKYFSLRQADKIKGAVKEIYYATGSKSFKNLPNITRLLNVSDLASSDDVAVIESNIDDMPSEFFDSVMKKLFNSGAKDVFFTPIYMKKNRPAHKITVLSSREKINQLSEILIKHTSTFGVRYYYVERVTVERDIKTIFYKGEKIRVKYGKFNDFVKFSPEYDDVVSASEKLKEPAYEIYKKIIKEAYKIECN
ncbi:MAG: hypothetical protein JG767_642 [Deferribacteraceae bacterium]|jgi:hypothetical protein|nr:hypothetical protein [Deferribacteraceae bacterium]